MQVDRIPTASLIQQYGKNRVYRYFNMLRISPVKAGVNSFISPEQDNLVRALHEATGQGRQAEFLERFGTPQDVSLDVSGRIETFQETAGTYTVEGLSNLERLETSQSVQSIQLFQILELLAQHLAKPQSPLANLEAIEQAYQHGWQLSSNQLAPLLGLKKMPKPPVSKFGFTFERVGKEWRISKGS